ncbi:sodium:proton exchanger [Desulfobacteraceae bacterium SEEP-SAG9]|nr:sodium:proton exchanger [Desulfobacteraceae bacterium SEEP-SAG9]
MDIWFVIMELVMLLGGAFFMGAMAQRLGQSPILGYLLAGTIVGPLLFNTAAVNQVSELGVALLLFSIGLEFSFKQLMKMGRMAFGGGTLQVVLTMLAVTLITVPMIGLPRALTVGAIVALSSTTVVLRLLVDRVEIDSVKGRACLAILLLQDIAIVPLVLMVSFFAPAAAEMNIGLHILKVSLSVIGLAVVFYLLLYHLAPVLLSEAKLFANRELTVLLSITVGFGAAWAAHKLHISPALGAFVAGMLLGESPFATQIRADIGSMRIIMVTLFFASVGMQAKPMWFVTHLHWVALVSVIVLILKTGIIYGVGRLFSLENRQALATGITLSQVGEFSFVLAATARSGGVLTADTVDLIVSVIIVLMLVTPYLIANADAMAERLLLLIPRRRSLAAGSFPSGEAEPANRVLVVGLGPAGRQVVQTLVAKHLEPVLIDVNPKSREYAHQQGLHLHLGDASHEEILMHAGLAGVCMAVVTIPDPHAAVRIVEMIRRLRPHVPIAVRCRHNRHVAELQGAGADIVVDEEITMGNMLSQQIVDHLTDDSGAVVACRLGGQTPEAITDRRP